MPKSFTKEVFLINNGNEHWLEGATAKTIQPDHFNPLSMKTIYEVNKNYRCSLQEEYTSKKSSGNLTEEITIDLDKKRDYPDIFSLENEIIIGDLSFNVEENDIRNFCKQLLVILRDPIAVGKYLKNLDLELEAELKKNDIVFADEDPYQFLISGPGFFMPGPPKEDYKLYNKNKILDRILLRHEQAAGVNVEGTSFFVGLVDSATANNHVAAGNIFKDDTRVGMGAFHNKNTHRFHFEIIRQAMAAGVLKLEVTDKKTNEKRPITQKELLELFVKVEVKRTEYNNTLQKVLWNVVIDSSMDIAIEGSLEKVNNRHYEPRNFFYSSRSPDVLNTNLLCFGNEMNIRTLQHYLYDAHIKTLLQMIANGRQSEILKYELNQEKTRSELIRVPLKDEVNYTHNMILLSVGRRKSFLPAVDTEHDFTQDFHERKKHYPKMKGNIGYKEIAENNDSPSKKPRKAKRETMEEYKTRSLKEKDGSNQTTV